MSFDLVNAIRAKIDIITMQTSQLKNINALVKIDCNIREKPINFTKMRKNLTTKYKFKKIYFDFIIEVQKKLDKLNKQKKIFKS